VGGGGSWGEYLEEWGGEGYGGGKPPNEYVRERGGVGGGGSWREYLEVWERK